MYDIITHPVVITSAWVMGPVVILAIKVKILLWMIG